MTKTKKTLILGASENPERYSNRAIRMLRANHHPVVAVGGRPGTVEGVKFSRERPSDGDINTVSIYLSAANQPGYYDYVLSLKPERIIFNPGTENNEFRQLAGEAGIKTEEACTLVLLSTGQY